MGGCSVRNCKNRSKKGLRVFKVPSDPERRKLWLSFCKRSNFPDSAQVCEVHFDESQFELHRRDGWKKLKHNAVPTIFEPHARGLKIKKLHENDSSNLNVENDRKIDDDGFYVKTNQKRCLVCYEPVSEGYKTVSVEDKVCTDFGQILLLLLKPSEAGLLTKYCCLACSENVKTCFSTLAELNLSTLLTYRRMHGITVEDAIKQGCPVCGSVYETRRELDQHFYVHLLNGDAKFRNELPCTDNLGKQTQGEVFILTDFDDGNTRVRNEHSYNKNKEWRSKECSLVCHFCGKFYQNRNNMTRHLKSHRIRNQQIVDQIQCEFCGTWFKQKSLRRHLRKTHATCRFQTEQTLNRHFAKPDQASSHVAVEYVNDRNDPGSAPIFVNLLENVIEEPTKTTSAIPGHCDAVEGDLAFDDLLLNLIPAMNSNHFMRIENLQQ